VSRDLIRRVPEALAAWFNDKLVCVDRTMHNAARIIRIPGTINRKGDNRPERPHRLARILDAPEILEVVTREQLERIAALLPEPELSTPIGNVGEPFDVGHWIAEYGIGVLRESAWSGGWRWIVPCFFDPSHGGTSAAIVQLSSGKIAYCCKHNSCADRKMGRRTGKVRARLSGPPRIGVGTRRRRGGLGRQCHPQCDGRG
jgi:hypothetical protein